MEDGEDDAADACDIDKETIGATAAPNFEKAQRLGRTGEDELKGSEYRQCECPRTPRWFYYQASPVRKVMGLRLLEKDALGAEAEHKFIATMWLDVAQMLDELDSLAPT